MSAAGEESGGAAVPTQGPVPVERVKAANGLEKVVLREVRGNTVEVRYCSLVSLSPPRFRLVGVSAVRSRYRSAAPAVAPGATSAIASPRSRSFFNYKCSCSGFSRLGWIDREKPVMN
jgi:hypothetical protein